MCSPQLTRCARHVAAQSYVPPKVRSAQRYTRQRNGTDFSTAAYRRGQRVDTYPNDRGTVNYAAAGCQAITEGRCRRVLRAAVAIVSRPPPPCRTPARPDRPPDMVHGHEVPGPHVCPALTLTLLCNVDTGPRGPGALWTRGLVRPGPRGRLPPDTAIHCEPLFYQ